MGSMMMAVPACDDHALRQGGGHADAPYRLQRKSMMQPCCDKHAVVPRALAGHGFAVGPGRPFDPEELCRRLREEKRRRDAIEQRLRQQQQQQQQQMEQAQAKPTRQSWQPSTAMRDLFRSSAETRHLRAKSGSALQPGKGAPSLPAVLLPPRPRGDLERPAGLSFAERLAHRRSVFFDDGGGPSQQPATEPAPVAPRRQDQRRPRRVDLVDEAPSPRLLVPPGRTHVMRPQSMGDLATRAGVRAPALTRASSNEAGPTTGWAHARRRPDWAPPAADPDRFVVHVDRTRQGQEEAATPPEPRVKAGFFRDHLGFLTVPTQDRKTVGDSDDDERSDHQTRGDVAGDSRRASEPWTSTATASPPSDVVDGRGRERRPLRRIMSLMSIFGKRK